ncbi:sugar ABC transporter substrate-binding protein [Notoacmeibacter marinus]|uniref:sugar ABC transporter substrate-binding protein n=1 Tax=Notoacmeibacter marinus TaxID=1876515 RepID=UPI0013B06597|nr:sugar ABC transporter substrate-binding protein [Notoacmeibacter marinus]
MAYYWKRVILGGAMSAMAAAGCAHAQDAARYGFSSNGLNGTFASAVARGFSAAAQEAGVEVTVLDSQSDVLKQTNDVADLVSQAVAGIAIHPNDSVVATAWADSAKAAGIPVVAAASMVGDPSSRPIEDVYEGMVALVTQEEIGAGHQVGELAARLLAERGAKEAKIAIVEGSAGNSEVGQRTEGFEAALQEAGQSYQIVATQPGDWTIEKGESACQNMAAANPDLDLYFTQSDDMAVGCARAVRGAGSDAVVLGMGGSKLGIESVESGTIDGTICYKPEEIGRQAFRVLHEAITTGAEPGEDFVTYDTPIVTSANTADCVAQW